mgnify:CR=1 FL=1
MSSPTERSLKALRDGGWIAQVVEKWIPVPAHPAGGVRKDLFGFIDIVAIRGNVTLGVQACRANDIPARLAKIRETKAELEGVEVLALPLVLEAGWRVEVHGWLRPNNASRRWRLRVVDVGTGQDTGVRELVRTRKPRPAA